MVREAGDVDDLLEQAAEEEQPDGRLDHAEREDVGLAHQRVELAAGQVPGVGEHRGGRAGRVISLSMVVVIALPPPSPGMHRCSAGPRGAGTPRRATSPPDPA